MLFDSLGHATVDSSWLDSQLDASFARYSDELKINNFIGGAVVGLAGKNGYRHLDFLDLARNYENLYPIAGYDPLKEKFSEIEDLKKRGFYGIKIHPRFSNIDFLIHKKQLIECFKICADLGPIFWALLWHELCNVIFLLSASMPLAKPLLLLRSQIYSSISKVFSERIFTFSFSGLNNGQCVFNMSAHEAIGAITLKP